MMTEYTMILKFLDRVCIKYGFCLPESKRTEIASSGPYEADDIAKLVIEAEGLNPDFETRHFRALRDEYTEFK